MENKIIEIQEQEKRMNYDDFKGRFGSWAESFKTFIESEDMFNIYQKIKEHSRLEIIVPKSTQTFRSFEVSQPEKIHTVIYLMDPYPRFYPKSKGVMQATGIALDCSSSPDPKRLQPSLTKFFEGISSDLRQSINPVGDLTYIIDQGVLLLNTDLTCKLNKTGSHSGLWEPFQAYFLQEIMGKRSGISYVLCGEQSHKLEKYIFPINNYVFKLDHPSFAARRGVNWRTYGVFKKLASIHRTHGYPEVIWDYETYTEKLRIT